MTGSGSERSYPLEEALRAQKALRDLVGLPPETFPVGAFVGMVSDEIEQLRKLGHNDDEIAAVIRGHSLIQIDGADIVNHYAPPEARHQPSE
jgi:hypothetical protein